MKLSGFVCMYLGGACMFGNHSMVTSLRGSDSMLQLLVNMEIYFFPHIGCFVRCWNIIASM